MNTVLNERTPKSEYNRAIINSMLIGVLEGKATLRVKVYNELITNIITNRKTRNKYQTNRILKPICTYFLLKSLTPSGVIREYTKLPLLEVLNVSKATFYKQIKELESLKLVRRVGDSLIMCSYERMIEMFDLVRGTQNITYINYTPKFKFYHLVEGSILFNSQREIKRVIENKIKSNAELVEHYKQTLSITTNATEFQAALLQKQIQNFQQLDKEALAESFVTELINADTNITARNIRKRFGLKSYKSVAYLKTKLHKCGIAKVVKRSYMSTQRCRKAYQYVEWNAEAKATIWRLPDAINFTMGIYV